LLCKDSVSLLGFGFLRIPTTGKQVDYEKLQPMVDYAIRRGVNYFETAHIYMNGDSEIALGRTLSKHDRSKLVLSTKMHMSHNQHRTREEIESIFNTQLKRLNIDYIDNYLFHWVRRTNWSNFKESRLYDFLCEKKSTGKIRHIGFSFHDTPELLKEVVAAYDWDFVQLQLNYLDWSVQKAEEQYRICADKGLPIVVMEPVRGGELARLPESVSEMLLGHDNCEKSSLSQASYAIRWVASLPQVACLLSGMSTMDHVQDNVATFENFRPITEAEQSRIDEAVSVYISLGMIPCTCCGYCESSCPREINIPTILTYANDYSRTKDKKWFLERMTIMTQGRQPGDCIKCNRCLTECPQHIEIPEELEKIAKMMKNSKPFLGRAKHGMYRILPKTMVDFLVRCYRKLKCVF